VVGHGVKPNANRQDSPPLGCVRISPPHRSVNGESLSNDFIPGTLVRESTEGETVNNFLIAAASITGAIVLTTLTVQAQGRGSGRGSDPPPPPQSQRPVAVPEPATLTLLGAAAVGGGLLIRHLRSRRKKA
jgi:PEP-CTERM motif-containing protein